jgi:hypothetical protein
MTCYPSGDLSRDQVLLRNTLLITTFFNAHLSSTLEALMPIAREFGFDSLL